MRARADGCGIGGHAVDVVEDNRAERSEHLFLTVYLGAIVAALLAATTAPQIYRPVTADGAETPVDGLAGSSVSRDTAVSDGLSVVDASDSDSGSASDDSGGAANLAGATETSRGGARHDALALGIAPIDFDLGETTASGASGAQPDGNRILVRKPVISQGVELGSLSVTIDENARLYAQRGDLQTLLEGDADASRRLSRVRADGLVSFQRLREFGVSLRYDPIEDHIVLQPG